jgi:putative N6-adenine-specific DNA methylase
MRGLLTTHKGMEDIAALEVNELTGRKAKADAGCVIFDIKEHHELFRLCYKSQSATGVYSLLSSFSCKSIKDFKINFDLAEWLSKKATFRVKCRKNSDHTAPTPELEKEFGALIIDHMRKKHKHKQKVSLENPDITVFIYLTGSTCHVGIDFAGFDLSKRNYGIFLLPYEIKGTVAYALVRSSGYQKNEVLLDPFSGSGKIPIEAALFSSNFPVNFYNKEKFHFLKFEKFRNFGFKKFFSEMDSQSGKKPNVYNLDASMKHINHAKKNGKIAGIDKKISFSRIDLDWLDTKFTQDQIDRIVTVMPSPQTKEIDKIYREFFYQADFILKEKGSIALIGKKSLVDKHSSGFKVQAKTISSGSHQHEVFMLSR